MPQHNQSIKEQFLSLEKPKSSIKEQFRTLGPSPGPPGTFQRQEQIPAEGRPFSDVLPFATELIPGAASAGGFALGAPVGLAIPGSIAGSILGAEAQTAIRGINPELFGQPRPSLEVAGEDFLGTLLGLGIGKGVGAAANIPNLIKSIRKPELPRQVGAAVIRDVAEETQGIAKNQRRLGDIAEETRGQGLKQLNKRKSEVNSLFEELREGVRESRLTLTKIEKGGVRDLPGGGKGFTPGKEVPFEIEGPIQIGFIQPELKRLKRIVDNIREDALVPEIKADFNIVKTELNNLLSPINTKEAGEVFIASFESVKRLMTAISSRTFGKSIGESQGLEVVVRDKLDQAIRQSFNSINPELNILRDRANSAFREFNDIFPQEIQNILRGTKQIGGKKVDGTMQGLIKQSLDSKEATDQLLEVLGGDKTLAREFFLSETLTNHLNKEGILNLGGFVQSLNKSRQNKGGASLLSDKQFRSIRDFFAKAEKELPFASGNQALGFSAGRFQLFGTFGAMRSIFKGNILGAVGSLAAGQGTKVMFELGPDMFTKALLLDPSKTNSLKGLLTGNFKNKNVSRAVISLLSTKGLIATLKIQDRKTGEFKTIGENISLNETIQQQFQLLKP